jgi:hypothetical protein
MKQFLISLDQTINTCCFDTSKGKRRWGFADETLSARAYRLRNKGWQRQYRLINKLFFNTEDHCKDSYESEEKRRQLPPEYRPTDL